MAKRKSKLGKYHSKRNFGETPEPRGREKRFGDSAARFVVQKHGARRLHYDFRLEMGGVLKSWAVPKGPSIKRGEKRLAVETEDHPLEYATFEGVIPRGNYGAGPVILWDRGTWEAAESPIDQYRKGKLTFTLKGQRLKGTWSLVRLRGDAEKPQWLLIRRGESQKRGAELTETETRSVESRRTLEEVRSKPAPGAAARRTTRARKTRPKLPRAAKKAPVPSRIACELATLTDSVPEGEGWIHENKFDGYRILAVKSKGKVTLQSRNYKDWTGKFPAIAAAVAALAADSVVLDGEVVIFGDDGSTDFQALQEWLGGENGTDPSYVAFDLLHLDGQDLRDAPLVERKEVLARILPDDESVLRFSRHVSGQGATVYARACDLGLEGLISKASASRYRAGRNRDWYKTKCTATDEFVIGGYTDPEAGRSDFGALLLGFRDSEGELVYSGRVGTGFTQSMLEAIGKKLRALEIGSSPFTRGNPHAGRRAAGGKTHWVKPCLVAQVRYQEWTRDGRLRHPAFLGLREDKPAPAVRKEVPVSVAHEETRDEIAGVKLTNPDRVLYPEQGLTKRDLAVYYQEIADWILPYVTHRPISVVRCPQGARKTCFFQRHPRETMKAPIQAVDIREKEGKMPYLLVEDLAGVIALVQYGVLELHPWGATADDVERPDQMIFDLDPGPGVGWNEIVSAAKTVRNHLLRLGLRSFPRTSGGKGLHVVVPIVAELEWDGVKEFSRRLSHLIAGRYPDRFVAKMTKEKRRGKIFIDYLRNGRAATSICSYSTRARPNAPVATPVAWSEVNPRLSPDKYRVDNVRKRLASLREDPWKEFFEVKQRLDTDALAAMEKE